MLTLHRNIKIINFFFHIFYYPNLYRNTTFFYLLRSYVFYFIFSLYFLSQLISYLYLFMY
ncbi:hypothetical protein C1645_748425 [Glomus cerebriforme]|uniref:Uncharacterized protein n=1 Tax=Glomus cerebriforme TaxID=658196 RepID=A0A397TUT1_9GLOM|nr:hypothetical protein C1645_748425 [Glomus cerebriforme]